MLSKKIRREVAGEKVLFCDQHFLLLGSFCGAPEPFVYWTNHKKYGLDRNMSQPGWTRLSGPLLNSLIDWRSKNLKETLTMAVIEAEENLQVHRIPQSRYVDSVRWLSPLSAFDKFAVLALFDSDTSASSIEIRALNRSNPTNLQLQSSWVCPSRVSSLSVSQTPQKPILAASTCSGSLHFLLVDPVDASLESELSLADKSFHREPISGIDLQGNGLECVSVDRVGRVNVITVGDSRLNYRRLFDSQGLVSYTTVKWASPTEFATGGLGFSLQWWDQRKPGGAVSQFKGNWTQGNTSGIVHSIDIHPSRKHVCLAGGSSGTLFAWDLRWQQQPIVLSGPVQGETATPFSESEVWEVHYDSYMQSSDISNLSSAKILPVMMCSEDGFLAVIEQGDEPHQLLAEPCAINSFDINQQNPADVICALEWESIVILTRL